MQRVSNLLVCSAVQEGLPEGDEIVVVDGGSRDRTTSIAKKHGAKVTYPPLDKYFVAIVTTDMEIHWPEHSNTRLYTMTDLNM